MVEQAAANPEDLLRSSIARVWNERDGARRLSALKELYAPDAVLNEPDDVAQGIEAISGRVEGLQRLLGEGVLLEYVGPVLHHHEVAVARWRAGSQTEPLATGMDVVRLREGRVVEMYVFIDPPEASR
ncbi:nuclear transport factor 2 family protein [Sphingomonas xinjiangensis]|uniref:SnoaL-like domain-containing protein n=1 Tax=Sphingomonas xinjiangensis TaxID=643568 RepID=A0A840YRM2_9SPHN|nr:nuclear transport factor 2 family protein [Sphingomonas xinjiangensis]MBB5711833.1 hypothetical protein [Sphingomonas xinjiangensis]